MKYSDYNKLSKEEKAKVPFKEIPTFNKIAIGFFLATMILVCFAIYHSGSDEVDLSDKKFSEMSFAEKHTWLTDYKNGLSEEAMLFQIHLEDNIKNQFQFPQEVEFTSGTPILMSSVIKNANTGLCFNNGKCLAKNALGVKSEFYWEVRYVLTDSLKQIQDVKIVSM